MKIHPAILVKGYDEYLRQMKLAEKYTDEVDVDIIDWKHTAGKTLTVEEALNIKTTLTLNFDLMMDYPSTVITTICNDPRVNRVIVNTRSLDSLEDQIDKIISLGTHAAISLNPKDKYDEYQSLFKKLNLIQIFTIEPGAQGNPFVPERLDVINELKKADFEGLIETDGCFNKNNAEVFLKYPIDIVSVGSALSRVDDPKKAFDGLSKIIEKCHKQ